MNLEDQILTPFREEVRAYIERLGTTPTRFGKMALGDPSFVFDLEKGRAPALRTMDKVRAFMRENPSEAA